MLARNDTSSDVMQQGSSTVTLSGPLWTGPLHNGSDIQEMIEMANGWGWIESGKGSGEKSRSKEEVSANQKLRELLDIMLEESDPNLQVGYIELDEVLQFMLFPSCCSSILSVNEKSPSFLGMTMKFLIQ
jgi:tRNA (guanine26-N2/guanine27-N2)-dimethyltransferase